MSTAAADPAAGRSRWPTGLAEGALAEGALAGVALAAGRGQRLRPLTDLRPKVLFPVAGRTLLDMALERLSGAVGTGDARLAVNAHHLATQVVEAVGERAHVVVEQPDALGTAGALANLRDWLSGRSALVSNADIDLPGGIAPLLDGWDGQRCRLLCAPADEGRTDFVRRGVRLRYTGVCLLPWHLIAPLPVIPSGLYEVLWRDEEAAGRLDVAITTDRAIDCGTPDSYLAANLASSGGHSVLGTGAVVEGTIDSCVIWDGAWVGPHEHLRQVIRAGTRERPVTVLTRT
ncbi:MAG: sugar phosphate nucleotidyltransferase [Angustibacter sp.]